MNIKYLLLFLIILLSMDVVAATCNCIIITDPTGNDSNGMAAGSLSYAENMFQSTFLMSKENNFVVLSGGEGQSNARLQAIFKSVSLLNQNRTPAAAASAASGYSGIRIVCGQVGKGASVGGSFKAYLIVVDDDDVITITPHTSGVVSLPSNKKGAIIHLRNTQGNPLYGSADSVRKETAQNIGRMIRDGYPATVIMGNVFEEVAKDSGEKYGGGAVNLVSGISTGDMFTPENINETGYEMDTAYSKSCPICGWARGYPAAESYEKCPICGADLKVTYAYDALSEAITITQSTVIVSTYGTDAEGVFETTQEIVKASVKKYGYKPNQIATSINNAIDNGVLVGVNYVEPKDINVKESSKAVGVYYTALANGRTSPSWNLPLSSNFLGLLGNVQTAIGFVMIFFVLFRSTLITSFKRNK